MCLTNVSLLVYMAVVSVALVVTVIAFVTPGWSDMYLTTDNATMTESTKDSDASFGLFARMCPKNDSYDEGKQTWLNRCEAAFDDMQDWEKWTIGLMVFGIIAEIAALVWSIIALYALCCKSLLTQPLCLIAFAGGAFISVAVIIYMAKTNTDMPDKSDVPTSYNQLKEESALGYSLYVAVFGALLMFAASIIGCLVHKVSKISPIG